MTYPQYQQPQAPQGPPPGYPQQYPPQQGYAPAYPQQPAPQAPPAPPQQSYQQPMPTNAPPPGFSAPPPAGQNYPRPKLADLVGRLVLLRPTRIERDVPNRLAPGQMQTRMTVDIVVLDGGPLAFGGSMEEGRPHTHQDPAMPVGYKGLFLSQGAVVGQLERYLPSPQNPTGGRCLARVERGQSSQPGRRAPYRLGDPTPADIELANGYLPLEQAGQLPYRSTGEPSPTQQAVQQQYGAPPAGPQYQPQQPAMAGPTPGYPPMGQPQPQGYPPMAPQPTPGQFPQYPPQQPGPAGYLANPDPGAQYQPQQPQQPAGPPPQATPWG